MQRWEYHLEIIDTDGFRRNRFDQVPGDLLNDLGREGWELVASDALVDATAGGFGIGQAKTMRIALWFKRPLA